MPRKLLIVISLISVIGSTSFAQKLKYKDVFPLLETKNYELGIPTLRKFLSDPKNASHANANYQMGLYYESKVEAYDLIQDSTAIVVATDSAIYFLTQSKNLITEKELKKNDDYYQSFYRRDLRTGDFGIKISDVQLEIENKLKALNRLNEHSKTIYSSLAKADNANNASKAIYMALVNGNTTINELYLTADDAQLDSLNLFIDNGEIIEEAFSDVRSAVSKISKKGYSPEIELNPINEFGVDGITDVNFFGNDVAAWDYGSWADDVSRTIKMDVLKMKSELVRVNQELKASNQMVKLGGGISYEELPKEVEAKLAGQLTKYDEDPLPLKLLNILIDKTEFDYITNTKLNPALDDLDDVDYQVVIADSLVKTITKLDESVAGLVEPYITDGAKRYPKFIKEEYGGDIGLIKYRKTLQGELTAARIKWTARYDEYLETSKWGVSANEEDSLYLVPRTDSAYVAQNFSSYYSIATMKDDSANTYVVGLEFKGDVDRGFISKVGKNRKIIWKKNFDLGKFVYSDSAIMVAGKFVPSAEGKVSSYIYSLVPESENNLIVMSASDLGEVSWTNEMKSNNEPVNVQFNDITKETVVFLRTEEEMDAGPSEDGSPDYIVIDRSGKVR